MYENAVNTSAKQQQQHKLWPKTCTQVNRYKMRSILCCDTYNNCAQLLTIMQLTMHSTMASVGHTLTVIIIGAEFCFFSRWQLHQYSSFSPSNMALCQQHPFPFLIFDPLLCTGYPVATSVEEDLKS